MRAYAAGDFEIFRRVRVPTALPFVFTALKVASVLAMIGAIVGEYFGGSFSALGVLINSDARSSTSSRPGPGSRWHRSSDFVFYLAVVLTERLVVRWAPEAGTRNRGPRVENHRNARRKGDKASKKRFIGLVGRPLAVVPLRLD